MIDMNDIMHNGIEASVKANVTSIKEVTEAYVYHSDKYYNGDAEISDSCFDNIQAWLSFNDPTNEVLKSVGSPIKASKKVKHPFVMGSLKKVHANLDELNAEFFSKFPKGTKFTGAPKIDGSALRIVYKNGILDMSASRGDGFVGEILTENIKAISSIPNEIEGFTGEIRGEVYMKRSVFTKLNETNKFANTRNAAAGCLRNDDMKKVTDSNLSFFCYDIIGVRFKTEIERAEWSKKNLIGIEYVPIEIVDDFDAFIKKWTDVRKSLDYGIDGLVFSVNDLEIQEDAGFTSDGRRPLGKYAYKFPAEQVSHVEVLNIDSQVGRTGKITPMARIEPTFVDGSTISNITLHNYEIVEELGISIGAKITIEKSGDIIPQVVKVDEAGNGNVNYPNTCPVCGGETIKEGKFVYCVNASCPAQIEEKINFYVKTMGMKNIGSGIIAMLLKNNLITDVPSLYEIDYSKMEGIEGVGKKTINEIKSVIEASKLAKLEAFVDALGIQSLGTSKSKLFVKKFGNINNIVNVTKKQLLELDGIQEKTANNILTGLAESRAMIEKLLNHITFENKIVAQGCLSGMSFCMTGSFSRKKAEIGAMIESNGGEVCDSVKNGLTYLMQADAESVSAKTQKAQKLGVKILGEDEFYKMIG